jgi:hypothetical protein
VEDLQVVGKDVTHKSTTTVSRMTLLCLTLSSKQIEVSTTRGSKDQGQLVMDVTIVVKRVILQENVLLKTMMLEVEDQEVMVVTSVVKKVTSLVSVRTNQPTMVVAGVVIVTSANSQVTWHVIVQMMRLRTEVATNASEETTIRTLSEVVKMKAGTKTSQTQADRMLRDNSRTLGIPTKDQTVAGASEVVHTNN